MGGRRIGFLACLALAAAAASGACGGHVTGGAGTGGTGTGGTGVGGTGIGGTDSGVGPTGGGSWWGGTGGTGYGGTGGTLPGYGGTGGTLPGSGGSGYGGTGGGTITCNPADPYNSQCDTCLQTTCCVQWKACEANQHCPDEFSCILNCIDAVITDAGSATNSDKAACAESCPSPGSATIDATTNDLFACANDPYPEAGASCNVVCLGG